MSNANFFGGISKVESASGKGAYFAEGDYLAEIGLFSVRASTHPDRKGQPMCVVEATIVEVLSGGEGSNRVGQRVAWFNLLERNIDQSLTAKGERSMGRIKNFVAAALGADDADITAEIVGALTEANPKENIGAGEALKGLRLRVEAQDSTSGKTGNTFTNVVWEAVAEAEEA